VLATLAKALFQSPSRLRRERPDVPWAVDDLVGRMLSQDRAERPDDGAAVLAELVALGQPAKMETRPPATTPITGVLTIAERRYVSIVVAAGQRSGSDAAAAERARAAGAPFGATVELLPDGTLVAALSSKGSARDQARQAARCALALRDVLEDGALALATGRAALGGSGLIGEVIERATGLLEARPPKVANRRAPIAIDSTTAGLLDAQFDVVGDEACLALRRERSQPRSDTTRTLLGKATPFVGREREMETLEAVLRQCTEDGVAHAVLVTAPSGAGKSRLRHEFLERVRARDERCEVWVARGDPMSAGSPLGMLGQIVCSTA
jgi:hypothetical protein